MLKLKTYLLNILNYVLIFEKLILLKHTLSPIVDMSGKPSSLLFVGDLSSVCTEAHIRDLFESNGFHVIEIKMMGKKSSSSSFDYGFVQLSSLEQAEEAMNLLNGTFLCGRNLRIRWAGPNIKGTGSQAVINSVHIRFQSLQVCGLIPSTHLLT